MEEDLLGATVLPSSLRYGLERCATTELVLQIDERHPEVEPFLLLTEGHRLQTTLPNSPCALQDATNNSETAIYKMN